MRHGLSSVCQAALIGGLLSTGTASAQSRPGWVDPPARAPQTEESAKEPAQPAPKADRPGGEAVASETPDRAERATPRRPAAEPTRQGHRETARAASRSEGARRHRRLAEAPTITLSVTPLAAPSAASTARFPEWASAAQRLTVDYLDSVSAPGDALVATAPRFYAERVRFHGRVLSLSAVMAEKGRFVRRWPVRRYEAQARSLHTACNAQSATCQVHATFDFRAENPARGALSQGVSELVLTIDVSGPRPVIVAEDSRVLQRYGAGPLSAIGGGSRRGA